MASEEIRRLAAAAFRSGRVEQALALLEGHCQAGGDSADWLALGKLKHHLRDLRGARAALETACAADQTALEASRALAHVLVDDGEPATACRVLESLLASAASAQDLRIDLGIAQARAGREEAALASFTHALELTPADVRALVNRAALLRGRGAHEQALADYQTLLAAAPDQAQWWCEYAECLRQLRRHPEAIASCDRALSLDPHAVAAAMCKAVTLAIMGELDAAQRLFAQAFAWDAARAARYGHEHAPLARIPDAREIYFAASFARLGEADWRGYGELVASALTFFATPDGAPADLSSAFPLLYLPLPNASRSHGHIAITRALGNSNMPPLQSRRDDGRRLRIGYLSCKFKDHPGMILTGGLFRAHDRAYFEVFGYALNRDDQSVQRREVQKEFDRFVDLSALSDDDATRRIRADGIDILVDLNGYSDQARPHLLAARAAPLQFSYLGHSHSLFAPWIDYRVSDRVSEPEDWGQPLLEARAFVPPSFYPYDTARNQPSVTPSRAALGLPEEAFVLCGFTRVEKIEPRSFARWLELLHALPQAVLWLGPASPQARANLRAHAETHGIAATRLVFVERVDHAGHLARHRAADLFLDTWTFNAHTTGIDALQAGLPVVTLQGQSWASRYGASLLTAVGLEELITTTPEAYCELVIALAEQRPRLMALREHLERLMHEANPFAPAQVAPRLGSAYMQAWERYRGGEHAADFDVD